MDPKVFAEKALRSIYFRERESIIPDKLVNGLAVPFRNLFPDLIFKIAEKKKRMDASKKID